MPLLSKYTIHRRKPQGPYLPAGSFSYTLPELRKTGGHIVYLSSSLAQFRFPGGSSYNISKHALNRLAEFVALENEGVHAYSLHPGAIPTDLGNDFAAKNPDFADIFIDSPELSAWTEGMHRMQNE